jgi:hypothetical protein
MATKNLLVRGGADFSAMQKGMKNVQNSMNQFKTNVSKALTGVSVAVAAIGAALTAVMVPGVKDAMEFEAHMGTLNQTLGESAKGFTEWMNTVGKSLGLSNLLLAKYGNQYSLTLKGIAKDQDDLAKKTQETIEKVALIRSKTGMDIMEISDRMRSAMNGEADGADELGVNVRVAAIEASKAYKMMANGQPFSELSQEMQKAIRWQHTMDSITSNLGNTMANNTSMKMARFTASLQNMRMALGQAWLPILNIALPALTKLSNALTRAFTTFAQLMSALFGYKADTGGGFVDQASAADSLSDSVAEVGDAYKQAGKKAKGALAGFDEVNTLSFQKDEKIDTPDTGGFPGGSVGSTPFEDNGKAQKLLKEYKPYIDKLREAFKKLKESINDLMDSKAVKWFMDWLKEKIPNYIKNEIEKIANKVEVLGDAVGIVAALLDGDWKKAWTNTKELFKDLQEVSLDRFSFFGENIGLKIGEALRGKIVEKWKDLMDEMKNDKFLQEVKVNAKIVASKIKEGFADTKTWFATKFKDISAALKDGSLLTSISTSSSAVFGKIKGAFNDMRTWFGTKVTDITKALADSKFLSGVGTASTGVFNKIKSVFSGVSAWFDKNVKDKIVTSLGKIKDSFKDGIAGGLKSVLNQFIDLLNKSFGEFNKFKNEIPIVKKMPNIPPIPRLEGPKLARGGIVDGATNFGNYIAGEAGAEMIVPLENTSFVDKLASALGTAVMNAMKTSTGSNGDIILKVNEIELGRVAAKGINKAQRTAGRLLLDI